MSTVLGSVVVQVLHLPEVIPVATAPCTVVIVPHKAMSVAPGIRMGIQYFDWVTNCRSCRGQSGKGYFEI